MAKMAKGHYKKQSEDEGFDPVAFANEMDSMSQSAASKADGKTDKADKKEPKSRPNKKKKGDTSMKEETTAQTIAQTIASNQEEEEVNTKMDESTVNQTPEDSKTEDNTPDSKTGEDTPDSKTGEDTPDSKTGGDTPDNKTEDTPKTTSNQSAEMATKIEELMKGGMSLTEAIASVVPTKTKATGSRAQIDRVAKMEEYTNIAELRKAIKVAFAKKSKSKGKPEAIARYQLEIEAGQKRLNELVAEINTSTDPISKAIELGEGSGAVLQRILTTLSDELEVRLADRFPSLSKKALKEQINVMTPVMTAPEEIAKYGKEYGDTFLDRAGRGDQRCLVMLKQITLLDEGREVKEVAADKENKQEGTEA